MENELEMYFVPHKESLELKEINFDEPCVGTYHDNNSGYIKFTFGMFQYPKRNSQANTVSGTFIGERGCYAPTFNQIFKWFIKEHDIMPRIDRLHSKRYFFEYRESDNKLKLDEPKVGFYDTYEEAELACLRKLIEIVKESM